MIRAFALAFLLLLAGPAAAQKVGAGRLPSTSASAG